MSTDTKTAQQKAVDETTRLQSKAAEPFGSRWVSANAGTGKTHVLVQRVLRLLLSGAQPDTILCLTYTNAAAAEMENRLFESLSHWAVASTDELQKILVPLLGHAPTPKDEKLARTLFATTLETAGGLKVQTIHSFCERLLRRFPLEANISPNSTLLDDAAARELKNESIEKVLRRAVKKPASPLGQALMTVIAFTSEAGFNAVIEEALGKRDLLRKIVEHEDGTRDPFKGAVERLYQEFALSRDGRKQDLEEQLGAIISNEQIEAVYDTLNAASGTARKTGEALMRARHAANSRERINHLHGVFLTKSHTPKKSLMAKAVRQSTPLMEQLYETQERFVEGWQQIRALRVARASEALLRLSSEIMQAYVSGKVQRAQLDFDDLIEKTNWLLSRSGGASWVLYKLDGGLDHILVDEAQDTSPKQWQLISSLAEEFFAGKGSHENERLQRTVFAVGDEKQSIYSFQGAQPELFEKMRVKMEEQAGNIGHNLPLIPLTLSFRSTPAVLNAVDYVFADKDKVAGITFGDRTIRHGAWRLADPGLVEVWELERTEKGEPTPVWDPLLDLAKPEDPKEKLAERIARTIRYWLDNKRYLPSKGRAIRPGDILILVRKRHPFSQPMIRALKRFDIPVAGADRMKVAEQIAVEDLMALGDFLLLPEDDLALATILKSPMFALDDDDLFRIRRDPADPDLVSLDDAGRERVKNIPLWWAFKQAHIKGKDERFSAAYEQLARWMMRADKVPPFELFAGILDINGMREKLTSRLGSEAGDAINEFLAMALAFDENSPPSLQNFLASVRNANSEIKRDMEKGINEVRIMTVHGAKGLEAEVVFMPDTTSARSSNKSGAVQSLAPANQPDGTPDHLIWCVPGSRDVEQIAAIKEQKQQGEMEEYNRLLYVAMTRARDELYICGWLGARARLQENSWYALIETGLEEELVEINDPLDYKVRRFAIGEGGKESNAAPEAAKSAPKTVATPPWMEDAAPKPAPSASTITPSKLIPPDLADHAREGLPLDANDLELESLGSELGIMRGNLVHALLEHLPDIAPELWFDAASRVLQAQHNALDDEQRQQLVQEVLKVLQSDEFAPLFGQGSTAECSFDAALPMTGKKGEAVHMSGQIDRLVVNEREILIIDYKSNRLIPASVRDAPSGYKAQLAAYRLALRPLFPRHNIRCALLWTRKPALMWLDDELLDEVERQLPQLAKG